MKTRLSPFQRWAHDGRLYAVLSAAGFSLKAIFVKLGYAAGPVDALTLLALRMGFALPLFLWLLRLSRKPGIPKQGAPTPGAPTPGAPTPGAPNLSGVDVVRIWVLALLGYYLSSLFDFYGLQYISSGLERLILYLYPTLVLVFHACISRRLPSGRTVQAMGICYVGLGIAFMYDLGQTADSAQVMTGAAWVLASAVTYALYYLGTGAMVQRIGSMRLAGLAGSASCILVLAHFLLFGHPAALARLPLGVWTNAALMALLSTALPIYWMALAIQRMGASQAATVGSLGPVLTIFASWALLGEPLSLVQLSGLALVLLGVSRIKSGASPKEVAAPVSKPA